MSNIVIKAENLGKSYIIGHEKRERYTALRDVIARKAHQIASKTKQVFKGGQLILGQEMEEFWALKDINFEVKQGDRVGIIGRNGAGKSTLLKILSRITEPTTGKVFLKGRVASLLEVGTGFHPELTGRENIYLNGAILGMSQAEVKRKFDEIVDFSGVEKFLDTPVKRFSSGMYVRLAFAVAAHLEPEILVVDEVLAVGDAEFQKKCLGKMEDVSTKEGRTVLFVSHNMGAIQQLCNSVIVLEAGKLNSFATDVKSSINKYLSNQIKVSSENNYNYEDDIFKLINFNVLQNENNYKNSVLSNDTDIFIDIEFELKKVDISFNFGYAIYNSENILLYWSITTDVKEEDWPKFIIGYNKIRGKIPSNFLNEGDYRIAIIASLHMKKWLINPETNSPNYWFSIKGGLSKSPYWYRKRPGILAPILNWEIVK